MNSKGRVLNRFKKIDPKLWRPVEGQSGDQFETQWSENSFPIFAGFIHHVDWMNVLIVRNSVPIFSNAASAMIRTSSPETCTNHLKLFLSD